MNVLKRMFLYGETGMYKRVLSKLTAHQPLSEQDIETFIDAVNADEVSDPDRRGEHPPP